MRKKSGSSIKDLEPLEPFLPPKLIPVNLPDCFLGVDPQGEGFLEDDPECNHCKEAETCRILTEARNIGEKGDKEEMRKRVTQIKSPSTSPTAQAHKFMPKSRRGYVYEALQAGTPEDDIIKKLVRKYPDYTVSLARRKILAVKKLAGIE
jgi:hypothetical protein